MPRPPLAKAPLQEAALRLFVEGGIDGTGIREIAKAAKVSEAALYRHWAGKDELVRQLYTTHLAVVCGRLDDAIATGRTLEERIRAAATAAYKLFDEEPLVFRFVLLSANDLRTALNSGATRTPFDVVTELSRDAVAADEARGAPVQLAAALVGVFLQTALFVLYNRLPGPLSLYVEPVTQACLRIMRPG